MTGPTDDERRLRKTVADEIQAIMDKHDVGGLVILASPESAAWRFVFPKWSGLQPDPVHGMRLRVRIRANDPGSHARAESTLHFVASLADLASDFARGFRSLWVQAKGEIESRGGVVLHERFGGGRGPWPAGRGEE